MPTGTVHGWSASRRSGWIKPDAGGERVYVHGSGLALSTGAGQRLEPGQRVEYQIGSRPKGPAAVNVQLLTGEAAPAAESDAE